MIYTAVLSVVTFVLGLASYLSGNAYKENERLRKVIGELEKENEFLKNEVERLKKEVELLKFERQFYPYRGVLWMVFPDTYQTIDRYPYCPSCKVGMAPEKPGDCFKCHKCGTLANFTEAERDDVITGFRKLRINQLIDDQIKENNA